MARRVLFKLERNFLNGSYIRRNFIAARAITPRRPRSEHAVLVMQRDAEAVDLQFGNVLKLSSIGAVRIVR